MIVASYNKGFDHIYADQFSNQKMWYSNDFSGQARRQVSGTFCSIGFGIVIGLVCGLVMSYFYDERAEGFFVDDEYLNIKECVGNERGEEDE